MADGMVTDLTARCLHTALDCTATQQRVVANNLANIETPGYTAQHARFEQRLASALAAEREGSSDRGLSRVSAQVAPTADAPGPDGNNVNVEAEMSSLAEATTRYQALVKLLDRKMDMVGVALGDGRSG